MNFQELLTSLKAFPVDEKKKDDSGYLKLIVKVQDIAQFFPVLELFFGPALKPTGQNPSSEAKKLTKDVGGVRKEQTVYYSKRDNSEFMAMIWPWSNGQLVTLRVFDFYN